MKRRFFLTILLISILILSFSYYFVKSRNQESFQATFSGCVNPLDDSTNIPEEIKVLVYQNKYVYDFKNSFKLSTGQFLGETNVKVDSSKDCANSYSITVEVPREMEIVLFAKTEFPETVWVDESINHFEIDLTYGARIFQEEHLTGNINQEISNLDYLDYIFLERKNNLKNETLKTEIENEFVKEAKEYRKNSNSEANYSKKLELLYLSDWMYYKALSAISYYSLQECSSEITKIVEDYDFRFHLSPFFDSDILGTDSGVWGSYDPYGYRNSKEDVLSKSGNLSLIEIEVVDVRRAYEDLNKYYLDCKFDLTTIKKDFEYQQNFVKYKILFLIAIIFLSFLLGLCIEKNKKIVERVKKWKGKSYKKLKKHLRDFFEKNIDFAIDHIKHTIYIPLGILAFTGYTLLSENASEMFISNNYISLIFTLISLILLSTMIFLKDKEGKDFKTMGHLYLVSLIISIVSIILGKQMWLLILNTLKGIINLISFLWNLLSGNPNSLSFSI